MTSSFQSTAFQPAASPVDTFVAEPSVLPKTNAEELAGILSSVNPALQNYFGAEINEKKQEQEQLGMEKVMQASKPELQRIINQVKKQDGRKNNGAVKGISRGQGRPRKIITDNMTGLIDFAIRKNFGSAEKMWMHIAKEAKAGNPKMWDYLMNYRYGKPKEMQQIDVNTKVNIPDIDFARPKTIDVKPENERIESNTNEQKD